MPSEPVSSYLDEAVEAALRAGGNGYHVQAAIEAAEPFIREQVQAELREAIELEATAAADNGDRFLAAALRQALTQLGGSEDG